MRRRVFIAGVGSAAAWPVVARAQRSEQVRRIGVLMALNNNDPEGKLRLSAFAQANADLGWTDGRNVRMDLRWGGGDTKRIRALAQELVGLQPDIILADSTAAVVAVQRETRTIPIVFANVADPVAISIVARLDRPNGNVTGFASFEATLGGKWLPHRYCCAPTRSSNKRRLCRFMALNDFRCGAQNSVGIVAISDIKRTEIRCL